MAAKYKVLRFVGIPLVMDASGNYQLKKDNNGELKFHEWRIGKHTKGHFTGVGQVFLTENNMRVAILEAYDVPFKERHQYTPMERFLSEKVDSALLTEAQKIGGN